MPATPLQSSVAVALPVLLGSEESVQAMVRSAGSVITGAVVSVTVMVCTPVLLLPQLSSAVQVRVITCRPTHVPGASLSEYVTLLTPLQSSVAVAAPVWAGKIDSPQSMVTLSG